MEIASFGTAISAFAVFLGVLAGGYIQLRLQYNNHQFQLASEELKRRNDLIAKEREASLQRIATTHRLLSVIGREFSRINLNIIWRAEMPESEYDQKYLSICREADELRAIAGLQEASLIDEVEAIHNQMHHFWGGFKDVLRRTRMGEEVDHRTDCFSNSHGAAMKIEEQTFALQKKLTKLAEKYRAHG